MKKIIDVILDKKIAQLLKIFDDLDDKGKNLIKLVEELVLYLKNRTRNTIKIYKKIFKNNI